MAKGLDTVVLDTVVLDTVVLDTVVLDTVDAVLLVDTAVVLDMDTTNYTWAKDNRLMIGASAIISEDSSPECLQSLPQRISQSDLLKLYY